MPQVKLSPLFNDQTFASAGAFAVGYKLFTYAAGSSTKQATYTDSTGSTSQSNPIIIGSNGYPPSPIWEIAGQAYKYVLAPPTDTDPPTSPVKTIDSISGVNDSSQTATQWVASGVTPTYINATTFTLVGDQTTEFHVKRKAQLTVTAGTVYGEILTSVYGTLTTVTMTMDAAQVLDSGLSAVNLSILRNDHLATPGGVAKFHGQCRLAKSGANLLLSPYNGNSLIINGVQQTIPSAGVTLAPTSLVVGTLYYIYAYMNAGTMTLEPSTTTHATDATTGVEIKSGDATRTLVGMARIITGPAWQDTAAQRFVRSWFNDPGIGCLGAFTANRSTTSITPVELNTEIRNEFLIWLGEIANISASGYSFNSTAAQYTVSNIAIDSTTVPEDAVSANVSGAASAFGSIAVAIPKTGLAEGYHYATLLGYASGNTGTWPGAAGAGNRCTVTTYIKK